MITSFIAAILSVLSPASTLQTPVMVRSELFPALAERPIEVGCVTLASGITMFGDNGFGGLSALRVKGDTAYIISDASDTYIAKTVRNPDGWIIGLTEIGAGKLADENGMPLPKSRGDSEGLVIDADNRAIVSFERQHRIVSYNIGADLWIPIQTEFSSSKPILKKNAGFEAATRLSDGRLMAISEGTNDDGMALVVTSADGVWNERTYRPAENYAVTDLATDSHTGDLIVIERAFSRITGVRARLTRISRANAEAEGPVIATELARLKFFHGIDNMEGITLERTTDGALRAHIISDDNFSGIQRTVLMGLAINESRECGGSTPTEVR